MESFKDHLSQTNEGTKVDTSVQTKVDTDAKEPEEVKEAKKKKYESLLARLQKRRGDIKV